MPRDPGTPATNGGSELFTPHPSWEEPKLPPVDRIRALAREVGYAIGEHGTKERDLDLIAAPWSEDAVSAEQMVQHIAEGLPARILSPEHKPLGRYAVNLKMGGWYKLIDLSVCPIVKPEKPQILSGPFSDEANNRQRIQQQEERHAGLMQQIASGLHGGEKVANDTTGDRT